ncbi:hypothetical protein CBS101457_002156 [Exobasidium rhododendri]|nr:hypothetical protein CBS101457_002156 [Exobasidium rhododendri]
MSLIAAIPQSTICMIASTRLYSQLAEEATLAQKSAAYGSHTGSSSSGGGAVSSKVVTSYLRQRSGSSPLSLLSFGKPRSDSVAYSVSGDLEKGTDFSESSTSSVNGSPKAMNLGDILETQSSAAVRAYQRSSTSTGKMTPQPFGNLAQTEDDSGDGDMEVITTLPILIQQVQQEEGRISLTQQEEATNEELAAKYPNLFRRSSDAKP